jgi:hypothetical protein
MIGVASGMGYYVLEYYEGDLAAAEILSRPRIPGHENIELDVGARVAVELPVIEFVKTANNPGELLDYVNTMFPGEVISTKFRAALEAAGVENVDYYPARILDETTGRIHDDYWVANIVGVVQCMDRELSVYTPMAASPDLVREIEELHLSYPRVNGKMFRLDEWFPLILVEESVRESIEANGLRGVRLVPAEGYST